MSEESFNSAGKTAAQQQGSRFEDEFTENDLAMVNLGYWDPSADTETDSESGEESDRENASVPSRLLLTRNTKPRLSAILIKI